MNYLIQRGKVRGQVINVPDGLPELLSDITREVLRCQPTTECLCQFIIDYLHSVIVTREKARMAKQIIDRALHIVDEIISDLCICDITKAKSEEMALLIEECFRRFLEKRRCERNKEKEIVKFHEEDILDELIKRCKFTDYELKMSRPMIEDAYRRFVDAYMRAQEGTEGTEALYQYFKNRELRRQEEFLQNAAAVRIQANYRGYIVRAHMAPHKQDAKLSYEEKVDDHMDDWEEQDLAARKIQKFYRMHKEYRDSHVPKEKCEPASLTSIKVEPPDEDSEEVVIQTSKLSPDPETAPPADAAAVEETTAEAPPEEQIKPEEPPQEAAAEPAPEEPPAAEETDAPAPAEAAEEAPAPAEEPAE